MHFTIPLTLALSSLALAQDISGPVNEIPTCEKSCLSSAFTKMACAQSDWKCFCSVKSGTTGTAIWGGRETPECNTAATTCSRQDQLATSQSLIQICALVDGSAISSAISAGASAGSVAASLQSAVESAIAPVSSASIGNATDTSSSGNGTSAALAGIATTTMASSGAASSGGAASAGATQGSGSAAAAATGTGSGSGSGAAQSATAKAVAGMTKPENMGLVAALGGAVMALMV